MISKKKMTTSVNDSCRDVGGSVMLRILICDDDIIVLNKMKTLVEDIFQSMEMKVKINIYSDPAQISNQILSSCDIALLDIDFENPKYNGMDIARSLRVVRKDSIIIFITNFIEYAPEGYEVQAFRYVLKRELDSELAECILLAIEQLQLRNECFKIQVNGEIIDLPLESILYMEVHQHSITAYIRKDQTGKNIKTYSFYASLSDLENSLASHGFLRIHKSYLVNMRHLIKFQCRQAILDNGQVLRVGEKGYAEKKRQYLRWKGWH